MTIWDLELIMMLLVAGAQPWHTVLMAQGWYTLLVSLLLNYMGRLHDLSFPFSLVVGEFLQALFVRDK